MCCFKPNPVDVFGTRIFAARRVYARQILVYSMTVSTNDDVAMILPVPVPLSAPEDSVKFINLEDYSTFFDDLQALFPSKKSRGKFQGGGGGFGGGGTLVVHNVGDFVASFVPAMKDFERLDERFRIDPEIWLTQQQYANYGFVVFQLKQPAQEPATDSSPVFGVRRRPIQLKPHPMAFEFPLREIGQRLFFPTVHIHDGTMPAKADFDHVLYAQTSGVGRRELVHWEESDALIKSTIDMQKASHLVLADSHCYRRELRGKLPNLDTWL